jgi:hypothetical protein
MGGDLGLSLDEAQVSGCHDAMAGRDSLLVVWLGEIPCASSAMAGRAFSSPSVGGYCACAMTALSSVPVV